MTTNAELADLIAEARRTGLRVSMSREGVFLIVRGKHHEITTEQAEVLWDVFRGLPPDTTRKAA